MGNVLRNIAVGLFFNFAFSRLRQSVSSIASNIIWKVDDIGFNDLSLDIRQGKLVGLVGVNLNILNKNAVSVYVKGYRATIYQNGMLLGSLSTTTNIELPSNQPRQLAATFVVPGEDFVKRLEALLAKRGSVLDPIQIKGEVLLNDSIAFPISQQINFFTVS